MIPEHGHAKKAREMLSKAGYKAGGHFGAKEMKGIADEAVHEHEAHDHPGKPRTKLKDGGAVEGFASGGRAHKSSRGKASTKINILVAPGHGSAPQPGMPMPPAAAPPHPMPPQGAPMPPPGAPPMGAPPMGGGMPPGAPMMGKPPMRRGGKVPGVRKNEPKKLP